MSYKPYCLLPPWRFFILHARQRSHSIRFLSSKDSSRPRLLHHCRELTFFAGDADEQDFSRACSRLVFPADVQHKSWGCTLAVPLWLDQTFAEAKGGNELRGKIDQHHNYTNSSIWAVVSTSFEGHQILLLVVRRHFFVQCIKLLTTCKTAKNSCKLV